MTRADRWTARILSVLILACAVAIVVLFVNFDGVITRARQEATIRRLENCRLFTGNWRQDIRNIVQTVEFLQSHRDQLRSDLPKLARKNLPQLIVRARINTPPNYCHITGREKRQATTIVVRAKVFIPPVGAPSDGER